MSDNVAKHISLMESLDSKTSEEAICALRNAIAEGNGIAQLVEYYAKTQSFRALELLCLVQEPHDRVLLDKMLEHMNRNQLGTIILLGRIVQKAPSWLAKFAHHCLFRTILNLIQLNENMEFVSAAILFVTTILPYCSTMTEAIFEYLFNTLVESCRILLVLRARIANGVSAMDSFPDRSNSVGGRRNLSGGNRQPYSKPIEIIDSNEKKLLNQMHAESLQMAINRFFQTLYGLYPCNFLYYLKNLLGKFSSDTPRTDISFCKLIEELFLTVRFHPALVFDCKTAEFSRDRWMAHEAHDFFALSQKISISSEPIISTDFADDEFLADDVDDDVLLRKLSSDLFPSLMKAGTLETIPSSNVINIDPSGLVTYLETPPNTTTLESLTDDNLDWSADSRVLCVDNCTEQSSALSNSSTANTKSLFSLLKIFKSKPRRQCNSRKASITPEQNKEQILKGQDIEEFVGVCADEASIMDASKSVELAAECIEDCDSLSEVHATTPTSSTTVHRSEAVVAKTSNCHNQCSQPGPSGLQNQAQRKTSFAIELLKNVTCNTPENSNMNKSQPISTKKSSVVTGHKLSKTSSLSDLQPISESSFSIFKDGYESTSHQKRSVSRNLCSNCSKNLEHLKSQNLLLEMEEVRRKYVSANVSFHTKLKEIGLVDRCIGKISDDMQHLLNELTPEKKCEVLFARLRLVSQNLMFERYCRFLHETRNRRLFGKLKQQRTIHAEYNNLKKSEHKTSLVLDKQMELCRQLKQKIFAQNNLILDNEKRFNDQLQQRAKENEKLLSELETLQFKYNHLNVLFKENQTQINQILLQNENVAAEHKFIELDLKEMNAMQCEIQRLQHEKQLLENELKLANLSPKGLSLRQRADEMVIPLYEAQLKNLRQHIRKAKLSLNRAMEKNRIMESQWKEELDRRLDLQSTLGRASIIHSKNLEAAQHKFNTLLAICNKQEAHIFNLYRALESQTPKYGVFNDSKFLKYGECATTSSENPSKNSDPIPIVVSDKDGDKFAEHSQLNKATIPCDSSFVFSDVEAHSKIADLFAAHCDNKGRPDLSSKDLNDRQLRSGVKDPCHEKGQEVCRTTADRAQYCQNLNREIDLWYSPSNFSGDINALTDFNARTELPPSFDQRNIESNRFMDDEFPPSSHRNSIVSTSSSPSLPEDPPPKTNQLEYA